ncbi:TRAUB-domain-containing protein [Dacryopinax primogenitus]|uniref:Protein BFR2 n=1 Tax=Dacryopinax primogenitus (strain DJM 731) TaxID=1858805 RepID=M5GBN3_DACPD|nr:TRAUB-domain-containing protein [Dacryopinax primogenitus]EJU03472.1 TRAUB-domain-containing protein [Dacryopinax primogenitus]
MASPPPTNNSTTLKGNAITQQHTLHAALLSSRIALQKSVTIANRLPLPDAIVAYREHDAARDAVKELEEELRGLEEELASVQEVLCNLNGMNAEERPLKRKRPTVEVDEDEANDRASIEHDFATHLHTAHAYHSQLTAHTHAYTLQTLSKWSSKVLAVHPTLFQPQGQQGTGTSKFAQQMRDGNGTGAGETPRDVVQAVEMALANDGLKRKTRGRVHGERRIGAKHDALAGPSVGSQDRQAQETDVDGNEEGGNNTAQTSDEQETFSDGDFYGSLLREIIDSRRLPGTLSSEALTQLLPNRRSKQLKPRVDTKASKGRKIRYEVHDKLRRFMMPSMPVVVRGWGEAQVDELFGSLLGGGGETGLGPVEEGTHPTTLDKQHDKTQNDTDIPVGQLRVFG